MSDGAGLRCKPNWMPRSAVLHISRSFRLSRSSRFQWKGLSKGNTSDPPEARTKPESGQPPGCPACFRLGLVTQSSRASHVCGCCTTLCRGLRLALGPACRRWAASRRCLSAGLGSGAVTKLFRVRLTSQPQAGTTESDRDCTLDSPNCLIITMRPPGGAEIMTVF